MEAYNQLRETLGLKSSSNDYFAIAADLYKATKLVIGKDTEHALEATFTRLNTRANALLTVTFQIRQTSHKLCIVLRISRI